MSRGGSAVVRLEIFNHLFAAIAEEMGVHLMQAALSPNIKERRDYSCAIFGPAADMIAQAAHIPVHLGSTPLSVEAALSAVEMKPDGHVLLNDPFAGGTHLPDLTLVTPVFSSSGELLFVVANRAHHADVGGLTPGSMGLARSIHEEGFRIAPQLLTDALMEALKAAVRTPEEREGDLRAQIAANRVGARRLVELVERYGVDEVRHQAAALQDYSERMIRAEIEKIPDGEYRFEDAMDNDGLSDASIPIRVCVQISGDEAHVDFAGTAAQVEGPVNAVYAITLSACQYVFRCLAPDSLPTNAGVMRPITVVAPEGSVVNARYPAAVAVGNVETSQRIVDVVMGALALALPERIPAASCGSMNNITIGGGSGEHAYAYYETIGGGAGASAQGPGASAVHTHMTNTLNTPVEALEHAYPFRVERYTVRRGSGGAGVHAGGAGVVRAYRFQGPATVTLQTERRKHAPYGLSGGSSGARGRNVWIHQGVEQEIPAKCTLEVEAGDVIVVETPGGGGWGRLGACENEGS